MGRHFLVSLLDPVLVQTRGMAFGALGISIRTADLIVRSNSQKSQLFSPMMLAVAMILALTWKLHLFDLKNINTCRTI